MKLAFVLSMPGCPSWNGHWSGEGKVYAIIRTITNQERAKKILDGGPYRHFWDDGWTACIKALAIDAKEASALRKKSRGFYGYDWMVDNIISYGNTTRPTPAAVKQEAPDA